MQRSGYHYLHSSIIIDEPLALLFFAQKFQQFENEVVSPEEKPMMKIIGERTTQIESLEMENGFCVTAK